MSDAGTIDAGDGHSFLWILGDPEEFPTTDERFLRWQGEKETLTGIIERHPRPDNGQPCGGAVNFVRPASDTEGRRAIWEVHSLDPLDISPSILCSPEKGGCGSHGYIRQGKWVPA